MNELVRIYWNSHKKQFSVQKKLRVVNLKTNAYKLMTADPTAIIPFKESEVWRVQAYSSSICLSNCKFVVRQAGRARVQNTGRKNVHAWVEGRVMDPYLIPESKDMVKTFYDPYSFHETFTTSSGEQVHYAKYLIAHATDKHPLLMVKDYV